jgi:hypothetical protein
MTCLGCAQMATRNTATLHDGRTVCTQCPDWIAECDARTTLRMPTKDDRRRYLDLVAKRRGRDAADELKALMLAIHNAGKAGSQEVNE